MAVGLAARTPPKRQRIYRTRGLLTVEGSAGSWGSAIGAYSDRRQKAWS